MRKDVVQITQSTAPKKRVVLLVAVTKLECNLEEGWWFGYTVLSW